MTHLNNDLDKICRDWCPLLCICADDQECENRKKIKEAIIEIAELDNEN